MKYQIKFTRGELAGQKFPVSNDSISIGRSRSNDIVLETPDISRKHVIISNKGPGLFIDNLSSRFTSYGTTELKMGDSVPFAVNIEISIGKENGFVLEAYNASSSDDDHTVVTQDNDTILEQKTLYEQYSDFETIKTNPSDADFSEVDQEDKDVSTNAFMEFEAEQTVGLKTRIATPEEIQMVKETEKRKLTQKYFLWITTSIIVLIGLGFYYYFSLYKAPEAQILWPKKNGKDCIGFARITDKSFNFRSDIRLAFPETAQTTIRNSPGMIEIATFTGKYMDVPCYVRLEFNQNLKGLKLNRDEAFEDWMNNKSTGKNSWNFDIASPLLFYLNDNGIPYYSVSYSRTVQQSSVCGVARFFRFEDWEFALTVEIPGNEKWRGITFLNQNFIQFSNRFVLNHWEGLRIANPIDKTNSIYEARMLLFRQSPSVWGRVEYLLKTTLVLCNKKIEAEKYAEAIELLRQLRTNQIKWFNEQKIAYYRAETLNDKNEMKRITENCKAVFSSPEDKRFHLIRQDNWR